MRPAPLVALLVAALGLGLRVASAAAETTPVTSIAQLMVLEPGDRNYRLFHGTLWLDADKAIRNYRWGGAQCPGKDLSPASVQILFAAFRSDYAVSLEYTVTELKKKSFYCITGFTISKA